MAADAAGVRDALMARVAARRARIVDDARALGIGAEVEGEAVRLSGRGLRQRWMDDARLRELGRDGG